MEIFSSTDPFWKIPNSFPFPRKNEGPFRRVRWPCAGSFGSRKTILLRRKYIGDNWSSAVPSSAPNSERANEFFRFGTTLLLSFCFFSPPTYHLFGSIDVTAVFYARPIGSNQLFRQPGHVVFGRREYAYTRDCCRVCFPVLYCTRHVHVGWRL